MQLNQISLVNEYSTSSRTTPTFTGIMVSFCAKAKESHEHKGKKTRTEITSLRLLWFFFILLGFLECLQLNLILHVSSQLIAQRMLLNIYMEIDGLEEFNNKQPIIYAGIGILNAEEQTLLMFGLNIII